MSTWSRGSLGADTVASLEHMEPFLLLYPDTEQLQWSIIIIIIIIIVLFI